MEGRDGGRDDRGEKTVLDGTPADVTRTLVDEGEPTPTDTVAVPDDAPGALDTIHVPDDAPVAQDTVHLPDDASGALDTIHVPDDAPVAQDTVHLPDDALNVSVSAAASARRRRTLWIAALVPAALAALSCVAAVVFFAVTTLRDDVVGAERAGPAADLCAGGTPVAAVLAKLPSGSPIPDPESMRARIGTLLPEWVTVHRLSGPEGRAITLEVSRESWPGWRDAASGVPRAELCDRIQQALAARGAVAESFYASRAPGATAERIGTMSDARTTYAAIYDWLEPLALSTRCTLERGRRGRSRLVITCDLGNPRSVRTRLRITPVLHRDGVSEPIYREERVLEPGEHDERSYRAPGRADQIGAQCQCVVATLGIERDVE